MNYTDVGGLLVPAGVAAESATRIGLQSEIEARDVMIFGLQESIQQLERDLAAQGYTRAGVPDREFSKTMIDRVAQLARAMYLNNPLINNAASTKSNYVLGRGAIIAATDDEINEVIQAHIQDPSNRAEFYDHHVAVNREVELECDGQWFIMLFESPITGRTQLRFVPLCEITEIDRDPEDRARPWFYRRRWASETRDAAGQVTTTTHEVWHPDWRYNPTVKAETYGGKPVRWDQPIYHVKVGAFTDWKFGLSEFMASLSWARATKEMLENLFTVSKAKARIAAQLVSTGGDKGAQAAAAKLAASSQPSSDSGWPQKAPVGGVITTGATEKYQTINHGQGNGNVEEIRLFRQQVAAGVAMPDTFFGASDMGNHATAKSLARPVEFNFVNRQSLHEIVITNILSRVLVNAVKAGRLTGKGQVAVDEDGNEFVEWSDGVDASVRVQYPDVVELDEDLDAGQVTAVVDLISQALTEALPEGVVRATMAAVFPTINQDRLDAIFQAVKAQLEAEAKELGGHDGTEDQVGQDMALDSAQIASILDVIGQVVQGMLPETTARAIIASAFPGVDAQHIDAMFKGLANFKPAQPAPAPIGATAPTEQPTSEAARVEPGSVEAPSEEDYEEFVAFDLADVEAMLKSRTPAMQKLLLAKPEGSDAE